MSESISISADGCTRLLLIRALDGDQIAEDCVDVLVDDLHAAFKALIDARGHPFHCRSSKRAQRVHTPDAPDKAFIRRSGLAAKPFTEFGRVAQGLGIPSRARVAFIRFTTGRR